MPGLTTKHHSNNIGVTGDPPGHDALEIEKELRELLIARKIFLQDFPTHLRRAVAYPLYLDRLRNLPAGLCGDFYCESPTAV